LIRDGHDVHVGIDYDVLRAERLAEATARSPQRRCKEHGLLEVVLVLRWWERSGEWPIPCCLEDSACLLYEGVLAGFWDGGRWITTDVDAAWRDAWCDMSGADLALGRSIWAQIEAAVEADPPMASQPEQMRCAWVLTMRELGLDASQAWTIVSRVPALHEYKAFWKGDLATLSTLVEASRGRWNDFHATLWDSLAPRLRATVVSLDGDLLAGRSIDPLATQALAEFDTVFDEVMRLRPLSQSDFSAWSRRWAPDQTRRRLRSLYSWRTGEINHRPLDVPAFDD